MEHGSLRGDLGGILTDFCMGGGTLTLALSRGEREAIYDVRQYWLDQVRVPV
jgi:hypothetical protein